MRLNIVVFEQNCTFLRPAVQFFDIKSNVAMIKNSQLNYCNSYELNQELWYFNQTHAFTEEITVHKYLHGLASRYNCDNTMFGLLCGLNTTN